LKIREEREAQLTTAQKTQLDDDNDRELRTIFVTQLSVKSTDDDVFDLFETVGRVRDVRLITDVKGKSKGMGYVEFYNPESVPKSLALTGTVMRGVPIIVKFSEAERNQEAASERAANAAAQAQMQRLLESHPSVPGSGGMHLPSHGLDGGGGAGPGFDGSQVAEKLEEDEYGWGDGGGYNLSMSSRAMLMAKLHRDPKHMATTQRTLVPQLAPVAHQVDTRPHPGVSMAPMPTRCLLMRNMFDPATERNPNFDVEIKEDVSTECRKYGELTHVAVVKESDGQVFLMYKDKKHAQACRKVMNGRFFGGKKLDCNHVLEGSYALRWKLPAP
jgi:RNA-binding protein 39